MLRQIGGCLLADGRYVEHAPHRCRTPEEGGYFVQSVTLDEALGDLPRLDFVNMDLEGHEPQALEGFSRLMRRHRPVLLVEFPARSRRSHCLNTMRRNQPGNAAGSHNTQS